VINHGGTGFLACAGFPAQPGKAVPPVKILMGNDKPWGVKESKEKLLGKCYSSLLIPDP
jgi:hypothetical protein